MLNSSSHCKHPVSFTVSFHNLCICFIEMTLNKTKYQFSWQCLDFLKGKAESSSTPVTQQLLLLEVRSQETRQQPSTNICLKAPIRKVEIILMTYPSNQTRHLSSWQSACLVLKKNQTLKISLLLSKIKHKWDKGENICREQRFKYSIQLTDTSFCLRSTVHAKWGDFTRFLLVCL